MIQGQYLWGNKMIWNEVNTVRKTIEQKEHW